MGRGEHPRQNHHKNIQFQKSLSQYPHKWDVISNLSFGHLIRSYWEMLEDSLDKPFLEND